MRCRRTEGSRCRTEGCRADFAAAVDEGVEAQEVVADDMKGGERARGGERSDMEEGLGKESVCAWAAGEGV